MSEGSKHQEIINKTIDGAKEAINITNDTFNKLASYPYKESIENFGNSMCPMRSPAFGDFGLKFPRVNIKEHSEKYIYEFDVPGVKKEDITITEKNGILTIKGHRCETNQDKKEDKNGNTIYNYKESKYGSFMRSIDLREDCDLSKQENTSAKLNNGVLCISIKRTIKDGGEARNIDIN